MPSGSASSAAALCVCSDAVELADDCSAIITHLRYVNARQQQYMDAQVAVCACGVQAVRML